MRGLRSCERIPDNIIKLLPLVLRDTKSMKWRLAAPGLRLQEAWTRSNSSSPAAKLQQRLPARRRAQVAPPNQVDPAAMADTPEAALEPAQPVPSAEPAAPGQAEPAAPGAEPALATATDSGDGEPLICLICHSELWHMDEVKTLSCGHAYHSGCMQQRHTATMNFQERCPLRCELQAPAAAGDDDLDIAVENNEVFGFT